MPGGGNLDNKRRLCKMYITDGCTDIMGIETHFIKELSVFTEAGCKILVQNVQIRRGSILLSPLCVQILYGEVDRLIEKQKKTTVTDSSSSFPTLAAHGRGTSQTSNNPQTARVDLNSLSPKRPLTEQREIQRQMQQEQINHHQRNIHIEQQRLQCTNSPTGNVDAIDNEAENVDIIKNEDSFDEMEIEKLMEIEAIATAKKMKSSEPDMKADIETAISTNNLSNGFIVERNNEEGIHIEERLLEEEGDDHMDIPTPPSPPGSQNFIDLLTPPSSKEIMKNESSDKKPVDHEDQNDMLRHRTPSPLLSSSSLGLELFSFRHIEQVIDKMLQSSNKIQVDSRKFSIKAVSKKIIKFTCKKSVIAAILTMIDTDGTKCHVRFNSDLCEEVIGMTVSEYKEKEKSMSKEEKKNFKLEVCQSFRTLDKTLLYTIMYDNDPEFAYIPKTDDLNGNVSPVRSEGDDNINNNTTINSMSGSQRATFKYPLLIIKMSDSDSDVGP